MEIVNWTELVLLVGLDLVAGAFFIKGHVLDTEKKTKYAQNIQVVIKLVVAILVVHLLGGLYNIVYCFGVSDLTAEIRAEYLAHGISLLMYLLVYSVIFGGVPVLFYRILSRNDMDWT